MAARNVFLTCNMKAKVAYVGVSTRRYIQAKWSAVEVLQAGADQQGKQLQQDVQRQPQHWHSRPLLGQNSNSY